MNHFPEGQGRTCSGCLEKSRAALGIAPGCNPLESRVVRLGVLLLLVIVWGALVSN